VASNEKDTDGKRVYVVADIAQAFHVSRVTRAGPVLVSLIALSGSASVSAMPGVAVLRCAAGLPGVLVSFPAGAAAILVPSEPGNSDVAPEIRGMRPATVGRMEGTFLEECSLSARQELIAATLAL